MELVVVSGPDAGKRLVVSGVHSVGRGSANDLALSDGAVSTRHLLIRLLDHGAVEVTDLASRNGTWIDGSRLTSATAMGPMATVSVGHNTLALQGGGAGPAAHGFGPHPGWGRDTGRPPDLPSVGDAGPVAGGDVSLLGHHLAGRDLHVHEGLQIKTRMRPAARRLLHWGIFLFFAGTALGVTAMLGLQHSLFTQFSADMAPIEPGSFDQAGDLDLGNAPVFAALFASGILINLAGTVMIVVSLVMRRERRAERMVTRRS